jgi:acetylglutamate kinase
MVPVAPCLGLGADGEIYNINADHMAAAAAEFCRADRLIFMTDVAGVLDGDETLQTLDGALIEDLIRHNKVSGGMVLKLDAAKRALEGGVRQVRIVGGSQPGALLSAVNGAKRLGTRVMPMFPVAAPRKVLQRVRATG